ncbi:hypothetical protein [Chitinophaga varians]|uniref:hypothetical protein n=1 Tax=Chitinophaga varians TaxID=2202339 RepID=UPI00165FA0C5|nr:hypothetical protein [Chitinophaga varians]MBC9913168.1 hypothetical protein [Chitinophaga varians]
MTENVKQILAGYFKLTPSEQSDFQKALKDDEALSGLKKIQNRETFNESIKRATGPSAQNRCAVCGR